MVEYKQREQLKKQIKNLENSYQFFRGRSDNEQYRLINLAYQQKIKQVESKVKNNQKSPSKYTGRTRDTEANMDPQQFMELLLSLDSKKQEISP